MTRPQRSVQLLYPSLLTPVPNRRRYFLQVDWGIQGRWVGVTVGGWVQGPWVWGWVGQRCDSLSQYYVSPASAFF